MSKILTDQQIKTAETLSKMPGVTVNEVREAAGLGPHTASEIGNMTINLPAEAA